MLLIADLAAAEVWYTKLLGPGPDNRPMRTLVQWEDTIEVRQIATEEDFK